MMTKGGVGWVKILMTSFMNGLITMTSEAPTAVRLIFGGGFTQIRFMADEFPPLLDDPPFF